MMASFDGVLMPELLRRVATPLTLLKR